MLTVSSLPELNELSKQHPVLFFDGVCGLCNYYVDFVMKRDRKEKFLFTPLQGETALNSLSQADREDLNSLVLASGGTLYRKSSAVVRILWQLSWPWKLAGTALWLIPRPLRNWGYGMVARFRYSLFGQKAACRLPSPSERARFLS